MKKQRSWGKLGGVNVLACMVLNGAVGLAGVVAPDSMEVGPRYFINPEAEAVTAVDGTVFGAQFRLSNTGFDASFSKGDYTQRLPKLGAAYPIANAGNNQTSSLRTLAFTLVHDADRGFLYSVAPLVEGKPVTPPSLVWGANWTMGLPSEIEQRNERFTMPTAGGLPSRPGAVFNSLLITAQALSRDSKQVDGRSLAFDHLTFASPALHWGGGEFENGVFAPGTWTQRLIAEAPLSGHDWTLSGELHGVRRGSTNDEFVRLTIFGQQTEIDWAFAAVPEPSSLAFCGVLGLLSLLVSRYAIRGRN